MMSDSSLNNTNKFIVKKERKARRENYIFPNFLAQAMTKVDLATQYEATMLSMTLMSLGLIATGFYVSAYLNFQLWYKIFLVINCFFGVIFMWSTIITTFQQYKTYKEAVRFQQENREQERDKTINNLILKGGRKNGTIQKENGNNKRYKKTS